MRICILNWRDTRHPKSGGAEAVTMEHARGWVKMGHEVTWLTSKYSGCKSEENDENGVHIIRRGGSYFVYLAAIPFLLAKGRTFDVIVDEVHGIPFFAPLFTKTPVVVFIHEVAGVIWDFMYPFPVNVIGRWMEKAYLSLYRKCSFWTDAESTIDDLAAFGIPRENCTAIPCPIPSPPRTVPETDKEKDPTFVFVSRVVRMKGVEEVVKAFALVARIVPDASLWIVGGGDERYIASLQGMLGEYGVADRVRFWGRVDEKKKYELMARAHVLLHASVKEGWGLVVLEAAIVGTPSVVYNVSGLCDVVKDGKTGIVLKENTPKEMAEESTRLIADTKMYRRMQKEGRDWAGSLKWADVVESSMEVLRRAAGIRS